MPIARVKMYARIVFTKIEYLRDINHVHFAIRAHYKVLHLAHYLAIKQSCKYAYDKVYNM